MRLVPPHWRDLALVMATATLVGMTISLAIPLLSLVLEDAGVAPFWIGVNTAAGGLGIFLIAPFIRRVVARIGPADAIRLALLKVAARVTELATRIKVALPSCCPYPDSLALLSARAAKLPP